MEPETMCCIKLMSKPFQNLLGRLLGRSASGAGRLLRVSDPSSFNLGSILIASGQITREQLDTTLEQQKHSSKKIGELLVESGYVQQNHVDQGLRLQQILVSAVLGTAIALSGPANTEAGGSVATFNATASVKKIARITVLHQQSQMVITSANINQGYLDVPVASRLQIRNSSLSGYMISFEVQEGPFQHILVNGLGTELQVNVGNGWLLKPHSRSPDLLELTYRFILSADAKPGTYPWPIQITVLAV
jgi:hypothetical protein